MQEIMHNVLFYLVIIMLLCTTFYSYRTRRQSDPIKRGLSQAKLNISMGILFISLSLIQVIAFAVSSVRITLAIAIALIGLFNLFAGMRNLSHFRNQRDHS